MKKVLYVLIIVVIIYSFSQMNKHLRLGAGVFAPNSPKQINIIAPKSFKFKNCIITPLARFDIRAKILSKYNYHRDQGAELSPVDLALGWGRMSDEAILDSFKIRQGNRTYSWRTKKFPIPRREIETSSANMHLIPANKEIKDMIEKSRKWEIVKFRGYLVEVEAEEGWKWRSSLTRKDTRGYSCEVVYVEKFEIIKTQQIEK